MPGIAAPGWLQPTQQTTQRPTPRTPNEERDRAERAAEEARLRAQQQSDLTDSRKREDLVFSRNQAAVPPPGGGNVATSGTANNNTMGAFDSLMAKYGGGLGGSSSSSSSSFGGGTGGTGSIGSPGPVTLDTGAIAAGDAAGYSRAKDQVGQSQLGLQKALTNSFASRGMRGSSIEGRALGSAAEEGLGQLADVSRDQAMGAADRSTDLAKTQYQGGITQRGQDITSRGQELSAQASERSSQAQAQQSKLASIMGLMSAFQGMRY